MNEQKKDNLMLGLKVLLFIIGITLGVASAFGCFNYATLAKEAGKPDNMFWLVGVVNLVFWVGLLVLAVRSRIKKLG